jgi:hypothetical protein
VLTLWKRENLPVIAGILALNRDSPSLVTVPTMLSQLPYVCLGDKFISEILVTVGVWSPPTQRVAHILQVF